MEVSSVELAVASAGVGVGDVGIDKGDGVEAVDELLRDEPGDEEGAEYGTEEPEGMTEEACVEAEDTIEVRINGVDDNRIEGVNGLDVLEETEADDRMSGVEEGVEDDGTMEDEEEDPEAEDTEWTGDEDGMKIEDEDGVGVGVKLGVTV